MVWRAQGINKKGKMTPYYQDEAVTLYCGDCMDVLPALDASQITAVITDPPWGMNLDTDTRRFSGGNRKRGAGVSRAKVAGDDTDFDPSQWLDFPIVVLWGMNHFAQRLPVGTSLVWVKKHQHLWGTFLSDGEIAWMKGGHGVYIAHFEWSNTARMAKEADPFLHPTQKPVELMQWCFDRAGVERGSLILDPYAGSGSTLVAAKLSGHRAIGIEIDESYCEKIANRLRQGILFVANTAHTETIRQIETNRAHALQ